jgi:hypothetical protein
VKLNPVRCGFQLAEFLPNETYVTTAARVLLRETGLPFSSGDLQLVRDEAVSIMLSDSTKHHVSVFASSAPSNFISFHFHTAFKIYAANKTVAIMSVDSHVVLVTITAGGHTLTHSQTGNVKHSTLSHELLQFGFVASSPSFRYAVREKNFFLTHDDDLSKDFLFSPCFSASDSGSTWKQFVSSFSQMVGEEPPGITHATFAACYEFRWTSCFPDRESTQGGSTSTST